MKRLIDTTEIDALEDEEATFCYGCDRDNSECECPVCPRCNQALSLIEQEFGDTVCSVCSYGGI